MNEVMKCKKSGRIVCVAEYFSKKETMIIHRCKIILGEELGQCVLETWEEWAPEYIPPPAATSFFLLYFRFDLRKHPVVKAAVTARVTTFQTKTPCRKCAGRRLQGCVAPKPAD